MNLKLQSVSTFTENTLVICITNRAENNSFLEMRILHSLLRLLGW